LALLVLNFPLGYGGLAVGAAIATYTKCPRALIIGLLLYGVSWLVLGVGALLTGHGGVRYAKNYWRKRLLRRSKSPP